MRRPMQRVLAKSFVLLSFIGILDAGYITMEAFTGGTVVCPLVGGCNEVLQSPYAQIFGYPVALYGLIFYFSIFILSFLYLDRGNKYVFTVLTFLPALGFLFTLWFLYLQAFVIKAYCFYCLISAGLSTILFALALWASVQIARNKTPLQPSD